MWPCWPSIPGFPNDVTEILDKYINLKDSCLDEKERKQVMEMLYEYKDVFSLREEIGT